MFAGRLFEYGARFLIAMVAARALGTEQYGLYNLALTTAILFASFATLGMDTALVRFVSSFSAIADPARVRGTIQVGVGLPAAVAIVVGLAMFALADHIAVEMLDEPDVADLLRLTAILVPLTILNRQLAATLQGFKRIDRAILAQQFAQPIVRLALIVVLIVVGLTALNAVLAMTVATAAATVCLAVFVVRRMRQVPRSTVRREPRQMLSFALPVYLSNVVTTVGHNIQIVVLGALGALSSIGIFSIASQISLAATLFHKAILAASMPLFAELQARREPQALRALYHLTSKWTLTLNLPFFLVVALFSNQLLGLFGSDFQDGTAALVLLAFGTLVNAATGTSGAVLDMTGHTRVKLLNSTVGVTASIMLSLLLIPILDLVGAALAVLLATSLANVMRLIEVKVLTGMSPYDRSFLIPIAAAGVALTVGLLLLVIGDPLPEPIRVGVAATALLTTYGLILLRFGLGEEDQAFLSRIRERLLRRNGRDAESRASDPPVPPDG